MTWRDRTRRTSFRATAGGLAMGWLAMTMLLTAWTVATAAVKDLAIAFVGWPIRFGLIGFACLLEMVVISPALWLGHRVGLRTRKAAMTLGALAGGLFGLAAFGLALSLPDWRDDRDAIDWAIAIQLALPTAVGGMLAAAVAWPIVYGVKTEGRIA